MLTAAVHTQGRIQVEIVNTTVSLDTRRFGYLLRVTLSKQFTVGNIPQIPPCVLNFSRRISIVFLVLLVAYFVW